MNNRQRWFNLIGKTAPTPVTNTATESKYLLQTSATFAGVRDAVSASFISTNNFQSTFTRRTTSTYEITRGFTLYNFSGVVGTVISAKLKIYSGNNINPITNTDIVIENCTNTGTLTTADFDSIGVLFGRNAIKLSDVNGYYYEVDLNAAAISAINLKGLVRFVVRNGLFDYDNIAPVTIDNTAVAEAPVATSITLTF